MEPIVEGFGARCALSCVVLITGNACILLGIWNVAFRCRVWISVLFTVVMVPLSIYALDIQLGRDEKNIPYTPKHPPVNSVDLNRLKSDLVKAMSDALDMKMDKPYKFKKSDFLFSIDRHPLPNTSYSERRFFNMKEDVDHTITLINHSSKTLTDYMVMVKMKNCSLKSHDQSSHWDACTTDAQDWDCLEAEETNGHLMINPGEGLSLPKFSYHRLREDGGFAIKIALSIKDAGILEYGGARRDPHEYGGVLLLPAEKGNHGDVSSHWGTARGPVLRRVRFPLEHERRIRP